MEPGDFIEFEETEGGVYGGQGNQTLQGKVLAEKKLQKTTQVFPSLQLNTSLCMHKMEFLGAG